MLIDESGDPGFKLKKGSSPVFAVAMVIFRSYEEAERTSAAIDICRETLGIKPEFKFSKIHDQARDAFFQCVVRYDFDVRAIIVEKERIYSPNLRAEKERFYNFFVQLLMRHDGGALNGARVKIDGSGDRKFKDALGQYLKRQLGTRIQKVKFANSRNDNLIQLADMAVGAIARSYSGRTQPHRWRRMLAPRIRDVWEFR